MAVIVGASQRAEAYIPHLFMISLATWEATAALPPFPNSQTFPPRLATERSSSAIKVSGSPPMGAPAEPVTIRLAGSAASCSNNRRFDIEQLLRGNLIRVNLRHGLGGCGDAAEIEYVGRIAFTGCRKGTEAEHRISAPDRVGDRRAQGPLMRHLVFRAYPRTSRRVSDDAVARARPVE